MQSGVIFILKIYFSLFSLEHLLSGFLEGKKLSVSRGDWILI